jgi:pyruvate-formate lyase-activating enzyme
MFLYETITKEIEKYPFPLSGNFNLTAVKVEITRRCTNACIHCANYGSRTSVEELNSSIILKLIDQAIEKNVSSITLWGGEPFLHPELYPIITYGLKKGMNIGVITNGFWGKSEQDVLDFVDYFLPLLQNSGRLMLAISCDVFHQTQVSTPLQNIINIISILTRLNLSNLSYKVFAIKGFSENILSKLYAEIPVHVNKAHVQNKVKYIALEYFVGRAKFTQSNTTVPFHNINWNYRVTTQQGQFIFVTASGSAVLYENFCGDEIIPVGNIKELSLKNIEQKLNENLLLKLLQFQAFKYFIYPFRKYLDIYRLFVQVDSSQIRIQGTIRDLIARILLIEEKEFDKSPLLNKAREIYYGDLDKTEEIINSLNIIDKYGDLSDVFCLKHMLNYITDRKIEKRVIQLLSTTYFNPSNNF